MAPSDIRKLWKFFHKTSNIVPAKVFIIFHPLLIFIISDLHLTEAPTA